MHADGGGLRELHIEGFPCGGLLADPDGIGCHGPRRSPDGRSLVFAAKSRTAVNVYTARWDGTGVVQVTDDGGSDNPDWARIRSHPDPALRWPESGAQKQAFG